jgi:hypothetical protein
MRSALPVLLHPLRSQPIEQAAHSKNAIKIRMYSCKVLLRLAEGGRRFPFFPKLPTRKEGEQQKTREK